MLSVKCEEIWQFDIREFSIKMNQETTKWNLCFTVRFCKYRNINSIPEMMEIFRTAEFLITIELTIIKLLTAEGKYLYSCLPFVI